MGRLTLKALGIERSSRGRSGRPGGERKRSSWFPEASHPYSRTVLVYKILMLPWRYTFHTESAITIQVVRYSVVDTVNHHCRVIFAVESASPANTSTCRVDPNGAYLISPNRESSVLSRQIGPSRQLISSPQFSPSPTSRLISRRTFFPSPFSLLSVSVSVSRHVPHRSPPCCAAGCAPRRLQGCAFHLHCSLYALHWPLKSRLCL